MNKQKLCLIGNGMAGVNVIEHILKLTHDQFEITIIGKEPYHNYNRILLSSVLTGEVELADVILNDQAWYDSHHIRLLTGVEATRVDIARKQVHTNTGENISYDSLILATGSHPYMLPVPGTGLEGVVAFRNLQDCENILQKSSVNKKAIVIGGGLLGLEAARGLLHHQMDVSVVHHIDTLMERQLDQTASDLLRTELAKQGMKFLFHKQTAKILGEHHVQGVQFADGEEAEADLVVMAVGIRPEVELARKAGITVNRGIVVNDLLETSAPDVYAVGECAEHRGMVYGLVAPLYQQGAVLAKHLCGVESDLYSGSVTSTKLKISGIDLFSAGEHLEQPDTVVLRQLNEWQGIYKKLLIRDNKLVGGILYGDASQSARLLQLIREQAVADKDLIDSFLVEKASEQKNSSPELVLQMADDEIICGCNGVAKGTIVQAITRKGLTTVDEVKACTGASRSCGGCKPLVQQLLQTVYGHEYGSTEQKQGICACTSLTYDEVIQEIKAKHLTHTREVMNVLNWENPEGCSKCRPALNYYLGMIWPKEHEDERESRFVNERLHANIQKDGTYSVIPRMYGGVTSPDELRKIADVADKYQARMVKLTGGQRIDLLGVKKADLPMIWEELGMPSGYAYAKALRTVKTCVGADFCRFGTQNSIQMGIDLEKAFERLNTPAKVKMSVSACPRNCAESGIKDLGVVGVDGGWEIYVGGNGGVRLRAGDLLCKVKSDLEVMAVAGAYLQYYRETGIYGERTSEWIERVGLDTIRQAVVADEQNQVMLLERLNEALAVLADPWKQIINDPDTRGKLFEEMQITL